MQRRCDRVLLLLSLASALAVGFGGFLTVSANRLARGTSLALWQLSFVATLTIAGLILALGLSAFARRGTFKNWPALLASGFLLDVLCFAASLLASLRMQPDMPALRISLGAAFWIPAVCAALAFLHALQQTSARLVTRAALVVALCAPLVVFARDGLFDALSLVKEFETHGALVWQALRDHLILVATALLIALLIAIPTILAARKKSGMQNILYSGLGIIQAIPSIALFGVLIAPLSALVAHTPVLAEFGIGGTGRTPAIIALVLYSLLPLVRNGVTGFASVPTDAIEAAKGLGFTARERFFKIDLPLAMPALLSGLRIVTVQAIGLASVAALIGAGGLGTFVFQGIGQYALDLVLVGAIPIILLAISADLFFQFLLSRLRVRI